jgi:hypothetical protein
LGSDTIGTSLQFQELRLWLSIGKVGDINKVGDTENVANVKAGSGEMLKVRARDEDLVDKGAFEGITPVDIHMGEVREMSSQRGLC